MPDRIDERRTSARRELERALDPVGPPIDMMARRRRRGRIVATSVAGFVFIVIAALPLTAFVLVCTLIKDLGVVRNVDAANPRARAGS